MTELGLINIPFESFAMWLLAILILLGIALLYFGGECLTKGASSMALRLRINPVVVGLTVVSIATSMPELVTSLIAVFDGESDLAMGNIVGSNLANIGLILGVGAVVFPLSIQNRLLIVENPVLLAVSILFVLLCAGGLGQTDGLILLAVMAVCLFLLVKFARVGGSSGSEEDLEGAKSLGHSVVLVAAGSLLLTLGARVLVGSSVEVAERFQVSKELIGLTMVAVGTSLPELAATIVAAARKESDLIAGNIIGSNFFNIVLIGGTVSLLKPIAVADSFFTFEFPIMILATVLMWLFFGIGKRVSRLDGVLLLIFYCLVIGFRMSQEFGG
ncbi:MAG: calcium/sodium antiporter [Verrucomicrobiota bacterium]